MEGCSNAHFSTNHTSTLLARYAVSKLYAFMISHRLQSGMETVIEEWLMKKYEGLICRITRERKEDLQLPNHLMGHRRLYLQLHFRNVSDLLTVRRDLMPLALANSAKLDAVDAYAEVVNSAATATTSIEIETEWDAEAGPSHARTGRDKDPREGIIDIREFDVPYYLRVAMDNEIRVGLWYAVTFTAGQPAFAQITERVKRADPVVMAYDIETTKAPLKFPDQQIDQVMMISYMIDGQGFLITNREIVSEDIEDFEYTPKEGYEGPFTVFNEADEVSLSVCFVNPASDDIAGGDHPTLLLARPRRQAHRHGHVQRGLLRFPLPLRPRQGARHRHVPRDRVREGL